MGVPIIPSVDQFSSPPPGAPEGSREASTASTGGAAEASDYYDRVKHRLDVLQELTKRPRAYCIGLLDSEYADEYKGRKAALDRLFAEAEAEAARIERNPLTLPHDVEQP